MPNQIENRTIFTGDNLPIMQGMNTASVDLIYLDPPFNSNRHCPDPIGSVLARRGFKNYWSFEDTKEEWWRLLSDEHPPLYNVIHAAGQVGGKGDKAYLIYMAIRLLEMKRILKQKGSIYLHCDMTMSHSLKMTMDAIFGKDDLRNEFILNHDISPARTFFGKKHDTIFWYSKSARYTLNEDAVRDSLWEANIRSYDDKEECTRHHTQKPLALLLKIIKASSNAGNVVLDPFCGTATTCIAAEIEKRKWIGIDISEWAVNLVKARLSSDQFKEILEQQFTHRTDIPQRAAHQRDAPSPSKNIDHILYGKQGGRCNGCQRYFETQNMTRDHILAKSKGGTNIDENLQLLCQNCNTTKDDRDMPYLIKKLKERGILCKCKCHYQNLSSH